MHCHVHIGTEKTGSSFLQCKLAHGRSALMENRIWFSHGAAFDEHCMQIGRISGGNALKLADNLARGHLESASELLKAIFKDAAERDASAVLLSSELLLRPLSVPGALKAFVSLLESNGFESVDFLLVLRQPVDQCVSLYKHRAKGGQVGWIDEWCKTGYTLPSELAGLRQQVATLGADLHVKRYERSDGVLDKLFFEDWLSVPVPIVDLPTTINPSLTLAELVLLQYVAKARPELVTPAYEALVAISPKEKVEGQNMSDYARSVATATVCQYADEWEAWNAQLPPDQQLKIPSIIESTPSRPAELELSVRQVQGLADLVAEAASPTFIGRLFWASRIRPALGEMKRALLGR